jgi:pyrroline-5-carboxylate reductase
MEKTKIAVIGAGNLGMAIVKGLQKSSLKDELQIIATKRKLPDMPTSNGSILYLTDNVAAVQGSDVVIICVQPGQFPKVAGQIKEFIKSKVIISTITGLTLDDLHDRLGEKARIVRAMPNTAIAVGESMTCLSCNSDVESVEIAENIFNCLGKTLVIDDDLMRAATVLGASGIAFWLRLIRATTQGGIQMGFDADEAKFIAVQTSLGAASILAENSGAHPEREIDKVTTPMGCTIRGLNEMEHKGLSSALIRGLSASYEMISNIKKSVKVK